jgi:hypothetical protein
MGFWILMAMLVCAVVAVVVSLAIESPLRQRRVASRDDDAIRWLAVIHPDGSALPDTWAGRLADALPDSVESDVVEAPGATLAELRPTAMRAADERSPDVLLLWSALDDVLAGVRLEDHERELNGVLEDLDGAGVTTVVGNVPDLSRLPAATQAGLPADELRLLTERWNGTIGRLAHHHGALVADLFDLSPTVGARNRSTTSGAASDEQIAVADRFLPVLRQALVRARRRRLVAASEEPL